METIKLTINTPRNQAAKCIETQKASLLGYNRKDRIKKQEIINDHQYYWIINIEPEEKEEIIKRCAKGEVMIKTFYHTLFKWIDRASKLCIKFKKAPSWIKKYIIRQLQKRANSGSRDDPMIKEINEMNEQEIQEFIKINDRKEMETFLKGELIKIEPLNDASNSSNDDEAEESEP